MYSAEGEEVELSFSIYPSNNVEDWLLEVERSMKASVRDIIERAIKAYPTVSTAFLLGRPPPVRSLLSAPLPAARLHPQPPVSPQEAQGVIAAIFLREHLNPELERLKHRQRSSEEEDRVRAGST